MRTCYRAPFLVVVISTAFIFIWSVYFIIVQNMEVKYRIPHSEPIKLAVGSTKIQCSYVTRPSQRQPRVDKPKLVLFYSFPDFYGLKEGLKAFKHCSKKCELTLNPKKFREADVVVFYSHLFPEKHAPQKRPGQIWVFFAVESPVYSKNFVFGETDYLGKFNWTMTYRYDSDFLQTYLQIVKKPKPFSQEERAKSLQQSRDIFANKTKMVAWFVSHCITNSEREKYVKELSKYIQVDIYGSCGPLHCDHPWKCLKMLSRDYKFYLSFENAMCVDYVTEKLLKVLDLHTIVPVVRGGADYHKIFPPNSVIDTKDFPSPASLAAHMKELAKDENAYTSMLRWFWDFDTRGPFLPMCDLCERLYISSPVSCVYDNVLAWWAKDTCVYPNDLNFSKKSGA